MLLETPDPCELQSHWEARDVRRGRWCAGTVPSRPVPAQNCHWYVCVVSTSTPKSGGGTEGDTVGGREGLSVTQHRTCAHAAPPPHPPSLPPFTAHTTHRTKSIFTLSWRTRSRAHITAYERSSLCISVSEGLIRNGQSRLEQWIKHLSRAILYNTVLTVRADIQRKWLKACANYHVSHPDAGFFSQWQVVACNILQSGFHRLNRKCLLSAAFDRVGRLFARAPGVLCRLVWQRCQKWNNKPVWQRVNIVAVFPNI